MACPCCDGSAELNPCTTYACSGGTTLSPPPTLNGTLMSLGGDCGCGTIDVSFQLVLDPAGNAQGVFSLGPCVCGAGGPCEAVWYYLATVGGCSLAVAVSCRGVEFKAGLRLTQSPVPPGGVPTFNWPCVSPSPLASSPFPYDCASLVLTFDFFGVFGTCGPFRLVVTTP